MKRLFQRKRNNRPNGSSADVLDERAALPFLFERANGVMLPSEHGPTVIDCLKHMDTQLTLLCGALGLSSAALLWFDERAENLSLLASTGTETDAGPFSVKSGIFGTLKERTDIFIAPYRSSSPAIPFLKSRSAIGSVYARVLSVDDRSCGLLCLVSKESEPWDRGHMRLVDKCSGSIVAFYRQTRDFLYADFERRSLQHLFNGLQTLNSSLGMESVYLATVEAIRCIVAVDCVAIAAIDDEHYRFEFISTDADCGYLERRYPLADSLVGQVVKYRRPLPEMNSVNSATLAGDQGLFSLYRSRLVLPLCREGQAVETVLVVAAAGERSFSHSCRKMLEMVADQVAVKIDLARAHERINRMTLNDPLTGIANRRAFERALKAMHERALRQGSPFSLLICDIDYFKKINDTYGHPFGDQVLKNVAAQMAHVVRANDLAARIGGEEFAVLIEGAGEARAVDVAERLRKSIEQINCRFEGEAVGVTMSIGIVSFPQHTENRDKLLSYADQALYQAKQQGRNRALRWSA